MLDRLSSSERRGIALVFAAACLAFLAWAFPNMSRIVTIPGAITTGILAFYFLWPEIQRFVHCLPATWDENGEVKGGKIRAATAILVLLVIIGASYWELRPSVDAKGFVLSDRPTLVSMFERDLAPPLGFMVDGCTEYNRTDGSAQITYYRVIGDVSNNTKILLFYVPSSKYSLDIIKSIATEYQNWITQIENTIHVNNLVQGNSSPVLSQNMIFGKVIYVYYEDTLNAIQIGEITKLFQDHGLVLQLRGMSYLMGAWDGIKAGRIAKVPQYQKAGCRLIPVRNN